MSIMTFIVEWTLRTGGWHASNSPSAHPIPGRSRSRAMPTSPFTRPLFSTNPPFRLIAVHSRVKCGRFEAEWMLLLMLLKVNAPSRCHSSPVQPLFAPQTTDVFSWTILWFYYISLAPAHWAFSVQFSVIISFIAWPGPQFQNLRLCCQVFLLSSSKLSLANDDNHLTQFSVLKRGESITAATGSSTRESFIHSFKPLLSIHSCRHSAIHSLAHFTPFTVTINVCVCLSPAFFATHPPSTEDEK